MSRPAVSDAGAEKREADKKRLPRPQNPALDKTGEL